MPPKATPSSTQSQTGALPVDLSISAQVEKIGEGAPATDLIKVLLQRIAIDVGQFVRDVHSSSQVYLRARVVYDCIQDLIRKVDSSAELEWDAFDIYTGTIPILERILLDFYASHRKESRDHLPPATGVDTAFIFITAWDYDRKMLEKAFTDLATERFLKMSPEVKTQLEASRHVPRSTDDINTLRALSIYFTANKLAERDIIQQRGGKLLSEVRRAIHGIIAKATKSPASTQETSRIVIMTLMLAYIPFALLTGDEVTQDWKDYLRSSLVWEALQRLLDNLTKHVSSQGPTVDDIEAEWEKVKDILLKLTATSIDTNAEILELLRLAARIRRPFHGRSVELIRMLYYLDGYSKRDQKVTRHRKDLKLVLDDTITSLESTQKAVSDVKSITLNADEYKKQETELRDVLRKVEETFSTFGIANQWSDKESSYNVAAKIDESHLTAMRQRLGLAA
ncbi:hypothetical protein CVT25_009469 [Psilocybe cyanescens]|uniref:Uncharacterized protein n=1 Tax=Psilocybe cyanescens TaxID=93625 RepID=A0A409XD74_PSICY|nr:hypothetical protein CVT25_009469 [Psilocybe cyanescens]